MRQCEEKTYEEVNDSDEIVDEEPMQTGHNIGNEDDDGLEDFENLPEPGRFVESNDEEMLSKRQKLMNKRLELMKCTLDMYVLNPSKDSKYVREFLKKWHNSDQKLFESSSIMGQFNFPVPNLVSICALLIWRPANPDDTITRIMFPGSTPQHKIFEGLEKLKHLEFLQYPACTGRQMASSAPAIIPISTVTKITKQTTSKTPKDRTITIEKTKENKILEPEPPPIKIKSAKDESDSKNIIDNKFLSELVDAEEKKIETVLQEALSSRVSNKTEDKIAEFDNMTTDSLSKKAKEVRKKDKIIIEKKVKRIEKTDETKEVPKMIDVKKNDLEGKIKTDLRKKVDSKSKSDLITTVTKSQKSTSRSTHKFLEKKTTTWTSDKKTLSEEKKSPPTTPKKVIDTVKVGIKESTPTSTVKERTKLKTRKLSPSSTPAKSAKEANNRRVVESKYKQVSPKRDTIQKIHEKKETKPKREALSRRPRPVGSPIKGLKSLKSPSKSTKTERLKSDNIKLKGLQKVNYEDILKDAKKSDEDTSKSLDDIKQQELDEKEEQEIVREIEAVFNRDSEPEEKAEFVGRSDIEKITCLLEGAKTEAVTDGEFEEEYLIIEKEEVERLTDPVVDRETSHEKEDELQKHIRDKEESEKIKEIGEIAQKAEYDSKIKTDDVSLDRKTQESKELSISVEEKHDISSEKKTPDSKSSVMMPKDSLELNILQESHPDEKISTTIESGATTAPTLPEDERIPLDDIKEDQHIAECVDMETKKIALLQSELDAPKLNLIQTQMQKIEPLPAPIREVVKTPDEVADLPLHEEVDYRAYDDSKKTPTEDDITKRKADTFSQDVKIPKNLHLIRKDSNQEIKGVQEDIVLKTVQRPSHAEIVTVTPGSAPESPLYPETLKDITVKKQMMEPVKEFEDKDFTYPQFTEKLRETHITTIDSPIKDEILSLDDTHRLPDKIPSIPEDIEKESEELKKSEVQTKPLRSPLEVEKIVADVAEVLKSDKSLDEIMATKSPSKSEDIKFLTDVPLSIDISKTSDSETIITSDDKSKSEDTLIKVDGTFEIPCKEISPVSKEISITSEEISDISDKTVLSDSKKMVKKRSIEEKEFPKDVKMDNEILILKTSSSQKDNLKPESTLLDVSNFIESEKSHTERTKIYETMSQEYSDKTQSKEKNIKLDITLSNNVIKEKNMEQKTTLASEDMSVDDVEYKDLSTEKRPFMKNLLFKADTLVQTIGSAVKDVAKKSFLQDTEKETKEIDEAAVSMSKIDFPGRDEEQENYNEVRKLEKDDLNKVEIDEKTSTKEMPTTKVIQQTQVSDIQTSREGKENETKEDIQITIKTMIDTDNLIKPKPSAEKSVIEEVSKAVENLIKEPDEIHDIHVMEKESPLAFDIKLEELSLTDKEKKIDEILKKEISKEDTVVVVKPSIKTSEKLIEDTKQFTKRESPPKTLVLVAETSSKEYFTELDLKEKIPKLTETSTSENIHILTDKIAVSLNMPEQKKVTLPTGLNAEKINLVLSQETQRDIEMGVKTLPETDFLTKTKISPEKPITESVSKPEEPMEKKETPSKLVELSLINKEKIEGTLEDEISSKVTEQVMYKTKDSIEKQPFTKSVVSVAEIPLKKTSKTPEFEKDIIIESILVSEKEMPESLDILGKKSMTMPKDLEVKKDIKEETKSELAKEIQKDMEMMDKNLPETLTETTLSPEKFMSELISKPEDQLEKSESPTANVELSLTDKKIKTDDKRKSEIFKEVTVMVPKESIKLLEIKTDETKDSIETQPFIKSIPTIAETPKTKITKSPEVQEDITKSTETDISESILVSGKEIPEKFEMQRQEKVILPKDLKTKERITEESKPEPALEIQKDVEMVVKTIPETDALTEPKFSPEKSIPTLVPKPQDRLEKSESPTADVELSLTDKNKKTDDTIKGEISKEVTIMVPKDIITISEKEIDKTKDVIETEPPVKSVVSVVDIPAIEIPKTSMVKEDVTKSTESATTQSIAVSDEEIPEKLDMPDEQTVILLKDIETEKHVKEETKAETLKETQKDVELVVKTMPETDALTETKLSPEKRVPDLVSKPKERLEKSESPTADVKISLPDEDKKSDDTIKGEISKEVTVKVPADFTKISEKEIDETKDVIETEQPMKSVVSVVDTSATGISKVPKVEEDIAKSIESATTESIPVSHKEILERLDMPEGETVILPKDIDSEKLVEDKTKPGIVKEMQQDIEMVVKTMPETDALTETKVSPEKSKPTLVPKPDDGLEKSKSPIADVKIPLPVEEKKTDDTIKGEISKEVTAKVREDFTKLLEKEIDETKDVIETEPPVKSVVSVVDTPVTEISKMPKDEEEATKSTESATTESIPVSDKEIPEKLDMPDEETVTLPKDIETEKHVKEETKAETEKEIQIDVEMVVKTMAETDALTETKLSPEKPVPDLVSKPDDRLEKSESPTADVKIPLPVEDKKTDDTIKGEISKEVTEKVPEDFTKLSEKVTDEIKDVIEAEPPVKSVVSVVDTPATEISEIPKVEDTTKSIESATTQRVPVSDKEIPEKLDMPDEQTVTLPKDIETEKHVKEETKAKTEKEIQIDVEMVVKTMAETDAFTETKFSPEKSIPDLVPKPEDRLEKSESPIADMELSLKNKDKKTDDKIRGEISKEVTSKVPEDSIKLPEKETGETRDVIKPEPPVKSVVSEAHIPISEISKITKFEEDITQCTESTTTESIPVSDKEITKKLDIPDEQTVILPKDIETEKHVKEETKTETEKEIQKDVEMVVKTMLETDALTETKLSPEKPVPDLVSKPDDRLEKSESPTADVKIPLPVEDKKTDDTIKGEISKEVTEKVPEAFTKISEKEKDETKDVIETEPPLKSVVLVVDTPATDVSKVPKVEEDATKSVERVTTESIPVSDKEIPGKLDMPDEQTVTLPKDIEIEKHVKGETKAETEKEIQKDVKVVVKTMAETDALTETKLSPEKSKPTLVPKPEDRLDKSESPTADVKIPLPVEDKKTDDMIKSEISIEVTAKMREDTIALSEKEIDKTKDVIETEPPIKSVVLVGDTLATEISKMPKVEEDVTKSIERVTTVSIPVSDKEIPGKLDMPDEQTVTLPKDIETEKHVKEETKAETEKEIQKDVEMVVKTMPETDALTETKLSPEKPVPDLVSKPDDRLEKSESPTADVKIPLPVEDKKTDDTIKGEISKEVTEKVPEDFTKISEKETDETKDVIETESPVKSVVSVVDTPAPEISKIPKVEEDVTKSVERVTTESIPVSDKEIPGKLDMPDEQTVTLPKDIETEKHVKEETKAEIDKEIQKDVEMVVKTMAETEALTKTKLSPEESIPTLVPKPKDRLEKVNRPPQM
ncbi:Microtubule-associated protein futsch [Eumeta japonica]|uniref:Microtubule-associated protein futsch n=1 Tax=Eumeta variegata TaxID=151549 RepID=A0A4C1TYQ6_EUMVA|nr:Microtubule-associated protein futsch [Eumeta japonica]